MAYAGQLVAGPAPIARMRGLKRFLLAALLIAACARMAAPPGGPARRIPPMLLSTFPDSGRAPCDFRGAAEFRFDEVTNDAGEPNFGAGTGTIERLILFSPDTAVPQVEWHRDRITVRPRGGWRSGVAYRIELLPGLADLHQNVTKTGGVLAFAVCAPKPTRMLQGRVVDWTTRRAMPGALVIAIRQADQGRYRTIADSTGRFRFESLPDGGFVVIAVNDQNRDHLRSGGEAWDSTIVDPARDSVGEIWTFARDTLPPRILDVTRVDSQTISVRFARPIDPALRLDTASARVALLPDTVSIGLVDAYPKPYSDSIHKPVPVPRTAAADSQFRRDSLRADSLSRAKPAATTNARPLPPLDLPKEKRPELSDIMIIKTRGLVRVDQSYFIELRNVRTAGGQTGPPVRKSLLRDLVKLRLDSLAKIRTDSIRADSIRKAKGDTTKVIKPR